MRGPEDEAWYGRVPSGDPTESHAPSPEFNGESNAVAALCGSRDTIGQLDGGS